MHSTTARRGRRTIAAAGSAVLALLATACTGSNEAGGNDDAASGKDVTITFWHGWSQDNEVKAIDDNIAAFEKAHPNIHVRAVGNIADDKVNQALRAGGDDAPDVVSSFTTNNVGVFCSTRAFVDLKPLLARSGIDAARTFPAAMLDYTQFHGNQCTLPLLGDAFGLYYREYAEAARMDGCGDLRTLLRVVLPMARPAIAAVALFQFFSCWNDYFGPQIYASENHAAWTLSYGLESFKGAHHTNWNLTMAATLLVMAPVIVLFFFAQKASVEGVTLTGVKG
ncbi:extracellular solute-binding protein [Streptomyces kaniharaensis]|uniref:Extracellular solute-binding protein n=1 Tax=Streptomyces kaniharaensis TaxID=212423 RepID=A0A6N7KS93_9ACTN|nr:extracellular solute-binding protein [Streptomyces kaniharaensis]MQS14390.1 extracellular solute-binding protein [Streptomyces kaniharaensis]